MRKRKFGSRKFFEFKQILLTGICVFCISGLRSQDPVFSHFYSNGLQLNPSFAGLEGNPRLFIGYRNQWPGAGNAYLTYHATYDQYVEKIRGGIGFKLMNDRQGGGVFQSYNLDLIYSYQVRIGRELYLSGGLQAGLGQRALNPSQLIFGEFLDPVTGISATSIDNSISGYSEFYPDFASGISFFTRRLYGGIALHHIFSPRIGEGVEQGGRIYRKYTAHFGAIIPIIENRLGKEILRVSPNIVVIQQQSVQQINYGLEVLYREFLMGLWTRHDMLFQYANIIFSTGYVAGDFRFRYSYDIKLSSPEIQIPYLGAHEISLLITFGKHSKRYVHRAIKCPKI